MSHQVTIDLQSRGRKRKALLAGGVVLGLGATMTLAAWTDDVWVNGSFKAGTFNVQGAVNSAGTDWLEYNSSAGGGLIFAVTPAAMTPGQSVYAPLNLRVGPNVSEYNAKVTVATAPAVPATGPANIAFFDKLRLSLYNVPPGNCNAAGTNEKTPTPTPALEHFDNAVLTKMSPTNSTLLTLIGSTSAPQGVCFRVTLDPSATSAVQGGQTGQLTWKFNAVSVPT